MIWSILLSGIPERWHSVHGLLYSLLEGQSVARMPDVELIYLMDNKRRPVGAKRNALLDMALGEYISFIDDDDEVAADYVRRIRDAIIATRKTEEPADVLCFRQIAHLHPANVAHDCSYSLEFFRNRKPGERRQLALAPGPDGKPLPTTFLWTGPPAHTQVWRRELVKDVRFPEENFGEDASWVDVCCAKASSEVQIAGEPLYHYKFDAERTATR